MSHQRRRQGSADAHFFVYTPGIAVPRDVTHVLVHQSVEVLPAGVFEGCRQLKEVKLPEGLREIGAWAFFNCVSLEHIALPSTLRKIGGSAIARCISLRELAFPLGLTEIGDGTFRSCSSLERIRVPSTVTAIGNSAFSECTSLRVVRLVDGIRTIGHTAFSNCALEDVMLPATLTSIDEGSFEGCRSLRTVKLCGRIQMIPVDAFDDCALLDHFMIPAKALVATCRPGHRHFVVATDRVAVATDGAPQVVIVSECFNSMCAADISEVELGVTEILGLQEEWDAQRERLCDFFAPYELRHKKEVTTLLELGLWKAKLGMQPGIREACRVNCGAAIIIPQVLSFL